VSNRHKTKEASALFKPRAPSQPEGIVRIPLDAIIGMGTAINHGIEGIGTFVLLAVAPLNLIKGAMISILTLMLYKKVARPIFGRCS
jgi:riboflavin transporter FmnP